jgi:uncharacterized protein YfdQ (DUF2303 family)
MSMKEALQYLVSIGETTEAQADLPGHLVLAPDTHTIHDIESKLPLRTRYRTQVSTSSLEDFAMMAGDPVHNRAPVFIDDERMSAKAIFNLGDGEAPGQGDHWAQLSLRKTPEFEELLRIDGKRLAQRDAAEWLEDWRALITPHWDSEEHQERGNMQAAINTVRNITIDASRKTDHGVSNFKAERSDLERIEARGRDMPAPDYIEFRCVPYEHLGEREILLRLSITTADAPAFTFRIVRRDQLVRELADEFQSRISEALGAYHSPIILGTLAL